MIADVSVAAMFLSPAECDEAVSRFPPLQPAAVNASSVNRRSRAAFLRLDSAGDRDLWRKLSHLLRDVVRDYRFELRDHNPISRIESVQLAEYAVGEEYDWHLDLGPGAAELRKLSVSVQLTDPAEYDGGDLEIRGVGAVSRAQGTAIVFPSFLLHRVTPVTRGTRRSLVAWAIGDRPFR